MKFGRWLMAGLLGVVAAVVYFASLADYAFPGESASLLAAWQGLDPAAGVKYPLMAAVAGWFGGGNVIAPVTGVLAVVLLFLLVSSFLRWRIRSESALFVQRETVALVGGGVAAIVFLFSPAVRSAATHLEPRLFDFTWALLICALAYPYLRAPRVIAWLFPIAAGAMTGVGFCDSALFLALLPLLGGLVVGIERERGQSPYLALGLFIVGVLVSIPIACGAFDLEFVARLKDAANEFKAYYSTPGWIFVGIFATLPFVTSVFSCNKAFNEPPELVQWLFHGAMTFVSVLAIATPLSPSALMEVYGVLPVATSAFAAATAGYLLAYWWAYRHNAVAIVVGAILSFVLLVTVVWNLFAFDGDKGAFADRVAERILADLGERKWFVTDGTLDSHLQLAAARRGQELNLISLARDLDQDYLDRLGELVKAKGVGGSKNGELSLSLTLGVLPFVQDWFASDPSVGEEVAIFGAPDLWYSAGITPVPEFLFFGADEKRVPDWSAWKEFDRLLEAPKGWGSYHDSKVSDPVARLRFSLRRHMGFIANNRGVYLQDKHKDDEAFKMYELVLNEIDHDNICTIFNEVGMASAKYAGAVSKQRELERMLKTVVDDKNRRYILWRLGNYYGYIRNPEIFIRLGHAWARSGRPGDALQQIRRAIEFVPSDKRTVLLNMMAMLYANENDPRKSRRLFESVLEKDSRDHDALIGLMRLELLDGNSAKAIEYLQRAAEASGEGKRAKIELAMVAMMKNDLLKAKELLKKAIDFDAKDMQAWSLLASVTIQQIDAAKGEAAKAALQKELENEILPSMEKQTASQFDYYLQATKGFILLRQGESKRREARDAFLAAAKSRPDITATQDMVLGLDISLDDKKDAERHAREVLRRNRNAPLANYVMGSLALDRGNYEEAEAFLRKAADAPQPVALALNDLAEVLRRGKKYDEAEAYARKATKVAPKLYVAWETVGAILMDQGRNLDEAESCIRKACDLSKTKEGREADVRMLISLARIQILNGDKQRAKVTVRKIQSRIDELGAFEKREFEALRQRAK